MSLSLRSFFHDRFHCGDNGAGILFAVAGRFYRFSRSGPDGKCWRCWFVVAVSGVAITVTDPPIDVNGVGL